MHASSLLLALTLSYPGFAFYPTKYRANLASNPGISHEQITEEAFDTAAAGMVAARREIAAACALADKEKRDKEWHFGDGDFEEEKKVLDPLKLGVLDALQTGRVQDARTGLGQILHIIQDIFGHGAEKIIIDSGPEKRDSVPFTTLMLARLSAAKERNLEVLPENDAPSPQGEEESVQAHIYAAVAAWNASVAIMQGLAEAASPRDLQHLFGLSLDSLVILDPSLRNAKRWPATRRALRSTLRALLTRGSTAETRYLGFRELSGVVDSSKIKPETLISKLREVQHGGEVTLIVAQPIRLDDQSNKDIVRFLAEYPVKVNVVQLQSSCSSEEDINSAYRSMADLSSGFAAPDSEALGNLDAKRDTPDKLVHELSPVISRYDIDAAKQSTLEFQIEAGAEQLILTIDCDDCEAFTILDSPSTDTRLMPSPIRVEKNGVLQKMIFIINNPEPGFWRTNMSSTSVFNATIQSRGPVQLVDFYLAEDGGRDGYHGFFPVQGPTLARTNVALIGELSGDFEKVEWLLVDARTGKETPLPMLSGLDSAVYPGYGDTHTFGAITKLPATDFYVVVRGDAQGYPFQKMFPRLFSPEIRPGLKYELGGATNLSAGVPGTGRSSDNDNHRDDNDNDDVVPLEDEESNDRIVRRQEASVTSTVISTEASTSTFFNGLTSPESTAVATATATSVVTDVSSSATETSASVSESSASTGAAETVTETTVAVTSEPTGSESAGTTETGTTGATETVTAAAVSGASTASGSGTTGSVTTGSVTTGSETTGSETTGSETTGSETTGSETTGSESTGSETAATGTTGSESTTTGTTGTQTAGTETGGTTTTGTVTVGAESTVAETTGTGSSLTTTASLGTSVASASAVLGSESFSTTSGAASSASAAAATSSSSTTTTSIIAETVLVSSSTTATALSTVTASTNISSTVQETSTTAETAAQNSSSTSPSSSSSSVETFTTLVTQAASAAQTTTTAAPTNSTTSTTSTTSTLVSANASAVPEKTVTVTAPCAEETSPESTTANVLRLQAHQDHHHHLQNHHSAARRFPAPYTRKVPEGPCTTETVTVPVPYAPDNAPPAPKTYGGPGAPAPAPEPAPAPSSLSTAAANATVTSDGSSHGPNHGNGKGTSTTAGKPTTTGGEASTGTAEASAADEGLRGVRTGAVVVVVVALGGVTFLML
ncbi:unnamed protein product [Parascedosporium putredinis]|uniref:Uncharacterized protein n=1 Tax=Parascedosporium putredinis TaxID=1442378 RepID=A0A9P1GVM9_9PEZI|nr:unnamed protein product [Parascedosporium putredinis]CAI7988638.1 unnamed protein product [Parascedosporium putredinis]